MSFLFNPMGYHQPSSNVATTPADYPKYRISSSYAPQHYRVNYNANQEVAQFKVFAFEKLNRGLDWSNATSIYRFELVQNRSFGAFLNELKNHGISLQSHKFCYLDDERDLVVLSTEYDFKYMLQIMKGKTIKIACEKIPQVLYNYRFAHPRASTLRNLPFFVQPSSVEKQEEKREETLIENALESVFNGIFEEKKQEETPQRRIHCMFPRPKQEQCNPRIRTIRLSDLLKQKAEESQQQSQKEEQVEKRSFEDYLAELFGKKLAERQSQDKNHEQATNESNEKQEETVTETTVEANQNDEQPIVEAVVEEKKEKPVLSTSQILSNYLIEDEDEDSEDEEDSFDENSSVTSEQTVVQYPTIDVPEEEQTSPSKEEELQRFEKELKLLSDMGFNDTIENLKLLNKYNGDIQRTVSELIYYH